jgi:hypothetical protein
MARRFARQISSNAAANSRPIGKAGMPNLAAKRPPEIA